MNTCTALVVRKKLSKNQCIILYFYLYSIMGWILETLYSYCVLGHFTNRGFLFGPLCPIYGFGAVIMLLFIEQYEDNAIKLFFMSAIIFSFFEYIVGFALDALFAAKWWDYTQDAFNINGRISLLYTFFWGIAGVLFIYKIHPFIQRKVDQFLDKIPYWMQLNFLHLLTGILITDTILSSIQYLNL